MRNILTYREREIYTLLALNYSTFQIAAMYGISERTVRNHISNVIQKLGVSNRSQAILELVRIKEITF